MREFSFKRSGTTPLRYTITGKVTGITIEVFPGFEQFRADEREMQYYMSHKGKDIFFQTLGYRCQKTAYIEAGIKWFVGEHLNSKEPVRRYYL